MCGTALLLVIVIEGTKVLKYLNAFTGVTFKLNFQCSEYFKDSCSVEFKARFLRTAYNICNVNMWF